MLHVGMFYPTLDASDSAVGISIFFAFINFSIIFGDSISKKISSVIWVVTVDIQRQQISSALGSGIPKGHEQERGALKLSACATKEARNAQKFHKNVRDQELWACRGLKLQTSRVTRYLKSHACPWSRPYQARRSGDFDNGNASEHPNRWISHGLIFRPNWLSWRIDCPNPHHGSQTLVTWTIRTEPEWIQLDI